MTHSTFQDLDTSWVRDQSSGMVADFPGIFQFFSWGGNSQLNGRKNCVTGRTDGLLTLPELNSGVRQLNELFSHDTNTTIHGLVLDIFARILQKNAPESRNYAQAQNQFGVSKANIASLNEMANKVGVFK